MEHGPLLHSVCMIRSSRRESVADRTFVILLHNAVGCSTFTRASVTAFRNARVNRAGLVGV